MDLAAGADPRSVYERWLMTIDQKTQTELEAAVFRRLVEHLRQRTDVQNLSLIHI